MSTFEFELPAVYLDNVTFDAVGGVVGAQPALVNRDPEPLEIRVPAATAIGFDLVTLDSTGAIDQSSIIVYVNGVAAVTGGSAASGWTATLTLKRVDTVRVRVVPPAAFASEQVVTVRVIAKATTSNTILDSSYTFTIADTAPPALIRAEAIDLNRIRVTFSESIVQLDATNSASALHAANWSLARLGDYLHPLVSAEVVSVEPGATASTVDLLTDIPLTPGGTYRAIAATMQDLAGNAVAAPGNVSQFLGWLPPVPDARDFDLYKKLPAINRAEDETLDLFRFVACLQEVANLLIYDIDRFVEILDPDTAPEDFVDAMLLDLGNPFNFDLELADKRRLAQVLVDMYQLKGTGVGITSVIRFFMGLEVTITSFNASTNTWILGDSTLGDESYLATADSYSRFSFTVTVGLALTEVQRAQVRSIVEFMKPAHTHFVRLIEPEIPVVLDHLELGLSELGDTWLLH
jgi:phage tail-like protein